MTEFEGKVVLVTGGASGIGRAVTQAFLQAGAKVAFTYMTSAAAADALVAEAGAAASRLLPVRADLTIPAQVEDAFVRCEAAFGPLDVLVANTGGLIARKRCVETTPEFWADVFAVNVTSTFLCCQAALRQMEPRAAGAIVLMSSLAAFDGGGPGSSHYAAAKGAVATYARALAKEVGALGIRVNALAPGLIATQFHDTFNTPQGRKAVVDRTPLRREGHPDDVANAVLFLASRHSAFITGEITHVNGGLGMY